MARIPVYTQNTLASGIPQGAPIAPAQTGSMLQQAGQTLDTVSDEQLRQQQLLKQKAQEDAVTWSGNAIAQAKLDLTQKYTDMQQNAAPGAPNFRGDFEAAFDKYAGDAAKSAPSPIAQQYLNRRLTEFKADMVGQAMQFEAGARIEKRVGDVKATIDKSRNLVSTNPALFPSSLGDITATINGSGLPEKQRAALLADATHGLAFSAISTQIDKDPAGTLKQLQSGGWDNYLDPDNRNALQHSAEMEIRQRDAEAKAAAREARMAAQTEVSVLFNDAVTTAQMTGKQDVLPVSKVLAAFPGAQGQKMVQQLQTAQAIGVDNTTIKSQPMTDDIAFLKSIEPQGGVGAAEDVARYQNAAKQIDQKQKALLTDGASYVAENVDTVKQAWAAVQAKPDDSALIKNAVALTKQAQLNMGVPADKVRVMPSSQAGLIAKQVTEGDPTKIGLMMDGVARDYGADGINDVIAAGAPPETKALAFADQPEQAMWRQRLGEALKVKPSELTAQVKARGIDEKNIDEEITKRVIPLLDTIPVSQADAYISAMKRIAMFNVASGKTAEAAAEDAWSAFDQHYQFAGTYRVPKPRAGVGGWQLESVQNGLGGVIANLGKMDTRAADSQDPRIQLDEEYRRNETVKSIQNGHYAWITNKNDDGVILTYDNGQPVKHKDGSWFEIKFDDAVAGKYGLPPKPHVGRIGLPLPQEQKKNSEVAHMEIDRETFGNDISDEDVKKAISGGVLYGSGEEGSNLAKVNPAEVTRLRIMGNRGAVIGLGLNLSKASTDPGLMASQQGELGVSVAGMYDPSQDQVTLQGEDITAGNPLTGDINRSKSDFDPIVAAHEFAHRGLSLMMQQYGSADPKALKGRLGEAVDDLQWVMSDPKRQEAYVRELQHRAAHSKWTDFEEEHFSSYLDGNKTDGIIKNLEWLASQAVAKRQPSGPR